MTAELLIIGSSGLAKEAGQLARQVDSRRERWGSISYVAEDPQVLGMAMPHGEVRYTDSDLAGFRNAVDVVIGVGHPVPRQRIAQWLVANSLFRFPNLVHPGVEIDAAFVALGRGNVICKGAVLTCDIVIGDFNWLNLNVTVGHDARIDSYCVVNPGANISGKVHLADGCFLGTGCQVLEGLSIPASTVVGAGAVVTRSIEIPGTYVGAPARRVK